MSVCVIIVILRYGVFMGTTRHHLIPMQFKITKQKIKKRQGFAALSLLLSQSQQYYVLQLFYFYSYKLFLEWLRTFGTHPIPSTAKCAL